MSELHAELFCDPFAPGTWRFRSLLTHVGYAFPEVAWTVRPVAAVPTALDGDDAAAHRDAARRAADSADLPLADGAFADVVPASWPACEALVAVRAADPDAARPFLDRVAARTFGAGDPPVTAAALATLAESVGVAGGAVREAVGSRRAAAAVGRDVERARDLLARLDDHEVRGDPPTDPLGSRLYGDGRPLDADSADPEPAADDDRADGDEAARADADATPPDRILAGPDSAVPRPPLVRLFAGKYTVVVDPWTGFQEFVDVLRRYDPDLGDLDWQAKLHGRHVMTAYAIPQRTAEHLSSERYGGKLRGILDDLGEAYAADLAACADLDIETVRHELRTQRAEGAVERADAGAWTLSNRTD